jgi:hypothetical protein
MTRANSKDTPGRCYNEEAEEAEAELKRRIEQATQRWCRFDEGVWAELKRHLEWATRQKIDWESLRAEFKTAARRYAWGKELLVTELSFRRSPEDTLAKLEKIRELSTALRRELATDFTQRFVSETSITRHYLQHYPPSPDNVKWAADISERYKATADSLQRFITDHQEIRTYATRDCKSELYETMFDIGQRLLNSQEVGRSNSSLLTFMSLALRFVLGNEAPGGDALRGFAYRLKKKRLKHASRSR